MKIKPGFYIGHRAKTPNKALIAKVYGTEGFYRIDVWDDIISSSGTLTSNIDQEKHPIVFLERITNMDKEG